MGSTQKETASKVDQMYHEANDAAKKYLKDRYKLKDAQRRAGQSEEHYEREEGNNEDYGERAQDHLQDVQDRATDAVENFYEKAKDHLEDLRDQDRRDGRDQRHREINEAVKYLRYEAREARMAQNAQNRQATKSQESSQTKAGKSLAITLQEVLASSDTSLSTMSLSVAAGASLGLLAFVIVHARTRRVQINQNVLG